MTDSTGTQKADLYYSLYGKLLSGTQVQPYGFSTKRSDFESGLVYYGYRFYLPHLSRWLNRDPIGVRGGVNVYGFVGGNPVSYVDPKGLNPLPVILRLCARNPAACLPWPHPKPKRKSSETEEPYIDPATELGPNQFNEELDEENCPVPDARPGKKTRGPTDQREKDGDFDTANDDFDNLGLSDVKDIPGGGRVGTLPDERTVVVRPDSSGGDPTLEIQDGRDRIKIRSK